MCFLLRLTVVSLLLIPPRQIVAFEFEYGENKLQTTLKIFLAKASLNFDEFHCIVLVSDNNDGVVLNNFEINKTSIRIKVNSTSSDCQNDISYKVLAASFFQKCQGYIIEMNFPECFLKNWISVAKDSLDRHLPYFLLVPQNEKEYASRVFENPMVDYISELTAVEVEINGNVSEFGVFASNFAEWTGSPGRISKVHLGSFSKVDDFSPSNMPLFPDKIKNLQGKRIRFATFDYPPFTMPDISDGSEIRFMKEFCKKVNCTFEFVLDDNNVGKINADGTGIGVLGAVYTDKADIGSSSLYPWQDERVYVAHSIPYMFSKISFLVPKARPYPKSFSIILPFTFDLWLIYITTLGIAIAVLQAVYHTETKIQNKKPVSRISASIILVIGMSVLQAPSTKLVPNSYLRQIFTLLEVIFLCLTASYSGALVSFLTVPQYYSPINTINEFVDSGLNWTADIEIWKNVLAFEDDPHMQQLVNRFEVNEPKKLMEMSYTGNYMFPVEITSCGYATVQPHFTEKVISNLHLMREYLYASAIVTTMRKGSPYMKSFDELVAKCSDHGLFLMWENIVVQEHLSHSLQLAIKLANRDGEVTYGLTKLTVDHIQGAFILLTMGLGFSLFVLVLELVVKHCSLQYTTENI